MPVTSPERTPVDVLDRPDLARRLGGDLALAGDGGILRPGRVIKYTLLLENATTAAKVGFFLEQHKEALMVEVSHLESLRAYRPRKPHYLMRGQRGGGSFPSGTWWCRWGYSSAPASSNDT